MRGRTKLILILGLSLLGGVLAAGLLWLFRGNFSLNPRTRKVFEFLRNPETHADERVTSLAHCGDAPFIFPTDGLIGFLWDDSFRIGHQHQGIDIFSGTEVGVTPVYAAYGGYLFRFSDWKASVIIRIPSDPLRPERQIWTYYTHMADASGNSFIVAAFPPGSAETFVPAGTLLGYQGNYSGTLDNPTGVHLHFSIVQDNGQGKFLNELEITNTLDPSPYFGLLLNGRENRDEIPVCRKGE